MRLGAFGEVGSGLGGEYCDVGVVAVGSGGVRRLRRGACVCACAVGFVECENFLEEGFRVGVNKVLREGACAEEAQGMASPFGFAEEDGDKVSHVSTNIANLPFAQG